MTLVKSFTFNPFSENTYLLIDEATRETIVIDPGCYTTLEQKILKKYITDNALIITRLLNTHCHLDHVFGNRFIEENYNVSVEIHAAEVPVLARAHVSGEMFGTPMLQQATPSVFLKDNDEFTLGDAHFTCILAPGHSPGSLCFYNEKEGFIISGDVLFFRSIGRTDLPGGSQMRLLESLKTRILTLPDAVKVYSGHGQVTTIGYERYNNPFLSHLQIA